MSIENYAAVLHGAKDLRLVSCAGRELDGSDG